MSASSGDHADLFVSIPSISVQVLARNDLQVIMPAGIVRVGSGAVNLGVKLLAERENIGPGENATLRVDLPTGHYLFVCNTPGHFAKNMYQFVNVE